MSFLRTNALTPRQTELIEQVRKLGLSHDEFMIGGAFALSMHGILERDPHDADLIVKPEVMDRLALQGCRVVGYAGARYYHLGDNQGRPIVDLMEDPTLKVEANRIPDHMRVQFSRARLISGLPVSDINDVTYWKSLKGSRKDLADLASFAPGTYK